MRERVTIIVLHHGDTRTITPSGDRLTVGRGGQNDLVIADGALSRRQCTFRFLDDGVFVEDNHSTCGTYVDGRLAHGPTRLRDGAEIRFGNSLLRVVQR